MDDQKKILREYFAAAALPALLSTCRVPLSSKDIVSAANDAFSIADEMVKISKQKENN
jgi:hypothetical protein